MLGEALKQLSGILSISSFKQMILTLMFILFNYASFLYSGFLVAFILSLNLGITIQYPCLDNKKIMQLAEF